MQSRLIFGAGYLGARVARHWLSAGDHVTVVTRSQASADQWLNAGASACVANVTDQDSLRVAFASDNHTYDSVLYCVGYDRSSGDDRDTVAVTGPRWAAEPLRGRFRHWVSTSSTSVYGQKDGEWVDEDSTTEPLTDSGQRCVAAENATREAVAGASLTILRLAGLYGPGRMLARESALRNCTPFPGDGAQWLNLIHVEDAVQACIAASDDHKNDLVLVSDDNPVRRSEYYGYLANLLDAPLPIFDGQPRTSRGAANKRCLNQRLKQTLVDSLLFPAYRDGLAEIS